MFDNVIKSEPRKGLRRKAQQNLREDIEVWRNIIDTTFRSNIDTVFPTTSISLPHFLCQKPFITKVLLRRFFCFFPQLARGEGKDGV